VDYIAHEVKVSETISCSMNISLILCKSKQIVHNIIIINHQEIKSILPLQQILHDEVLPSIIDWGETQLVPRQIGKCRVGLAI